VVEQNASMALSIADRGYVLQTGRVVLHDSAAALLRNPLMREAYLGDLA
jgi:branched-chain amino acid transport system ATP-binding protein